MALGIEVAMADILSRRMRLSSGKQLVEAIRQLMVLACS